jgi:hypothetical protein
MSGEIQRQTQCLKGEITQVEVLSSSSDNVDRDRPSEGKGGDEGSGGSKILIRGGNYRIVMAYRVQIH